MIAYVAVGADNILRAKRFYEVFLPGLDCQLKEGPVGLSYALPEMPGQDGSRGSRPLQSSHAPRIDGNGYRSGGNNPSPRR